MTEPVPGMAMGPLAPPPAPSSSKSVDRLFMFVVALAGLFILYKAYGVFFGPSGPPHLLRLPFKPGQTYALTSAGRIRFVFLGSAEARHVLTERQGTNTVERLSAWLSMTRTDTEGKVFSFIISNYASRGRAHGMVRNIDTTRTKPEPSASFDSRYIEGQVGAFIRGKTSWRVHLTPSGTMDFPEKFIIDPNPIVFFAPMPSTAVQAGTSWETEGEIPVPGMIRAVSLNVKTTFTRVEKVEGILCARLDQEFRDISLEDKFTGKAQIWVSLKGNGYMRARIDGKFKLTSPIEVPGKIEQATILVDVVGDTVMKQQGGP